MGEKTDRGEEMRLAGVLGCRSPVGRQEARQGMLLWLLSLRWGAEVPSTNRQGGISYALLCYVGLRILLSTVI